MGKVNTSPFNAPHKRPFVCYSHLTLVAYVILFLPAAISSDLRRIFLFHQTFSGAGAEFAVIGHDEAPGAVWLIERLKILIFFQIGFFFL